MIIAVIKTFMRGMQVEELPLFDAVETVQGFFTFGAGNNGLSVTSLTLMTTLLFIFLLLINYSDGYKQRSTIYIHLRGTKRESIPSRC